MSQQIYLNYFITCFQKEDVLEEYSRVFKNSIKNPTDFWSGAANDCHWYKKWNKVLDDGNKPFYKWFQGGLLNTCYNAIDIHIENGIGNNIALIYDSPVTNTIKKYTFLELKRKIEKFSGVLVDYGVKKKDRVIIYMPMIPETIIAMLACARIGAIHSVVFGGFSGEELSKRIDDCKPKVVVSASCGIEGNKIVKYKPLLEYAIKIAKNKPNTCIILQRKEYIARMQSIDVDWQYAINKSKKQKCVELCATDPLYILYTSGTTGQPKGVLRDNGGHLVALKWTMKNIYDINPGDVFWAASDLGWVVGHSYIVYGPLFKGATTILYEGKPIGTPNAGVFWRVIEQHKVKTLFTAPTVFRAIRKEDPQGKLIKKYDIKSLKSLFLAGERSDSDTIQWAEKKLSVPIIDHWWQTETGWPIAANCLGIQKFPIKYGSVYKPVPGWNLKVVSAKKQMGNVCNFGSLIIKLPLPPGSLLTLWDNDKRFIDSYLGEFKGFYKTSDAGFIDNDGYVFVMSRTDDIINVAGHRLSTGAIEEVLSEHKNVAECAVIGVKDNLKGQIPLGIIVLHVVERNKEIIKKEIIKIVRERIGPISSFKTLVFVKRLPKTRSGKILRGIVRKIADSNEYAIPATIDDPLILKEIEVELKKIGYANF